MKDHINCHQISKRIYKYHFTKKDPEWQVTNVSGVIHFSSGYRLAVSVYPSINFMGMKNDRRPSSLANSFVVLFFIEMVKLIAALLYIFRNNKTVK